MLPHVPDAWVDGSKTKVGYEIPLSRHFYVYEPPSATQSDSIRPADAGTRGSSVLLAEGDGVSDDLTRRSACPSRTLIGRCTIGKSQRRMLAQKTLEHSSARTPWGTMNAARLAVDIRKQGRAASRFIRTGRGRLRAELRSLVREPQPIDHSGPLSADEEAEQGAEGTTVLSFSGRSRNRF